MLLCKPIEFRQSKTVSLGKKLNCMIENACMLTPSCLLLTASLLLIAHECRHLHGVGGGGVVRFHLSKNPHE